MQYLQIEMMCPNWIYFDKANIKLVDIQINSMNCKGQLTKIQLQVKIYKWKRIYFKLWRYLENHNWYHYSRIHCPFSEFIMLLLV